MALADIIQRIVDDAEAEAGALIQAAEIDAEHMRKEAEAKAERECAVMLARAHAQAETESATLLAGARLRGRDRLITEKRVLIDRVIEKVVLELRTLEASEYAAFIAGVVSQVVRGGETLVPSKVDEGRLRKHLPQALKAVGVEIEIGDSSADVPEGVVLLGDRSRVAISPAALVETRRAELTEIIAEVMFEEVEG